jgi:ABC-2 type transport system ATP-binding protein
MVHIENLTMIYARKGKGIRDITFDVEKGAVVGFLGPNGSGKTTTIRCILGFLKGQSGVCQMDGRDCFDFAPKNMERVGFIAGETAFPELMTAKEYFEFMISVRAAGNKQKAEEMRTRKDQLCQMFELDFRGKIAKMSKGMKQKVAIVSAFMHDPEILILDEPSSGLDPFMQSKFVSLILDMKKMGKTVLISSHIFEEVEKTCDKIVIIRDGRIVVCKDIGELRGEQPRIFTITTPKGARREQVAKKDIAKFIEKLGAKEEILDLNVTVASLEDIYMDEYKEGR